MRGILNHFRIFLVLYRWFVCLTICLFFTMVQSDSTLLFSLLTLLIFINILVSILLFRPFTYKKQLVIAVLDSIISAVLLVKTGGWSSPLLHQAFSSLILLSFLVQGFPLLAYVLLFFLTTLLLPLIPGDVLILDSSMTSHLSTILQAFTFVTLYIVGCYVMSHLFKLYRHGLLLLRFIRNLSSIVSLTDLTSQVERLIARILDVHAAFFFYAQDQEHSCEWQKALYRAKLLEQQKLGVIEPDKASIVHSFQSMGLEDRFYYFPLLAGGKQFGCFVIPLEEKKSLLRSDLFFLNVLLCVLKLYLNLVQLKVETVEVAHEQMRKKLAQDMHDGLAQQLFFLSAQLFRMKQSLQPLHHDEVAAAVEKVEEQVKECHLEVRDVIANLRDEYKPCPIFDAVRKLLARITANSSIQLEYDTRGRVVKENVLVEEAIYRLVEESVYNVLKHANAEKLTVLLEATAIQWTITITDDGIGFDTNERTYPRKKFGLLGMKERVQRVGGTVSIHSGVSKGTQVIAVIPRWGDSTNVW